MDNTTVVTNKYNTTHIRVRVDDAKWLDEFRIKQEQETDIPITRSEAFHMLIRKLDDAERFLNIS